MEGLYNPRLDPYLYFLQTFLCLGTLTLRDSSFPTLLLPERDVSLG